MPLFSESTVLSKLDFWCQSHKYALSPEEHGVTRSCMLRTLGYATAGSLGLGVGFAAYTRAALMNNKRLMWTLGSFGAGVLGWEFGKGFSMRQNMRDMLSLPNSIVAHVTKEMYVLFISQKRMLLLAIRDFSLY